MNADRGRRTRYGFTLRRLADRRWQERIRVLQVWSRFPCRHRMDDVRRHYDPEFVLAAIQALAREQLSENRNIADARNLLHLFRDAVIHQARDREALPVGQA